MGDQASSSYCTSSCYSYSKIVTVISLSENIEIKASAKIEREGPRGEGKRDASPPPSLPFYFHMGECVMRKTLRGMFARQAIIDVVQL